MSKLISIISLAIVATIILFTTANASSGKPFVRMDCEQVFYASTQEGYETYHNLSIEGNNIVIHVDRIPARGSMMNYVTIITNEVFKIGENEQVDIISGTMPQSFFYSLRHNNCGTSVFSGEVQDDEMENLYKWIANMKNNQLCDLAVISSNTGKHHYTRVGFKNTSIAARCINDIMHR